MPFGSTGNGHNAVIDLAPPAVDVEKLISREGDLPHDDWMEAQRAAFVCADKAAVLNQQADEIMEQARLEAERLEQRAQHLRQEAENRVRPLRFRAAELTQQAAAIVERLGEEAVIDLSQLEAEAERAKTGLVSADN